MALNREKELLFYLYFLSFLLFGCTSSSAPEFDGEEAFAHLLEQCQFGPRNPGSEGHQKTKEYLLDKLRLHTNFVKIQDFSYSDQEQKIELELTNIIASFYPKKGKRVLLCAHWDTRPFADRDPDTTLQAEPILGANDGASGVAVLLEIARIISRKEPVWGVDIVLFDGEDGGREGDVDGFCLGSKYFAKNKRDYKPKFGILLDMIGDRDLTVYQEGYSSRYAKEFVDLVWSRAKNLGLFCFKDSVKYFMYDDHIPLLEAGIPVIDIIDFDYPYWHTTSDTPDKCSPESLQKIGDLLLEILYGEN
ncbi:MAG: M28 family peptidase [candidate division Zixibacteria bacterium]|nr:M28 family peptidase [candidate division Zixibacteria bacterium]